MLGDILVFIFLASVVIIGAVLAFFLWLNFRSATVDTRSYDDNFEPGKPLTSYRNDEGEPEPDPYDSLRFWEMGADEKRRQRTNPDAPPPPGDATDVPLNEPAPAPLDPIVQELLDEGLPLKKAEE